MARLKYTGSKSPGRPNRSSIHRNFEIDGESDGLQGDTARSSAADSSVINASGPSLYDFSDGSDAGELVQTPLKRKRGRPPKSPAAKTASPALNLTTTPSNNRKKNVIQTPVHLKGINGIDTPRRRNGADRSARRKSARALIDQVVGGASSDEEAGEEDIVREIYESSEDEEDNDADEGGEGIHADATATPSAAPRGTKRRASTRKRSPTPPTDLPPHERYFFQNKTGLANKTSANTLGSLDLLTHEEYFALLPQWKDRHAEDVQYLETLHVDSFPQWLFELSQGFSVCLYGYGSKRPLLKKFATHIFHKTKDHGSNQIVMVNGYLRNTTTREILSAVGKAIEPSYKLPAGTPITMVQDVLARLSAHHGPVTLVVHCIDASPLRKSGMQSILAQLAAHAKVRLVCSVDTPDFALLWDSGLRAAFNFVFHDCTTFAPYNAEIDVVDEVHELVGRKARRVGGKDGVVFVLRSLPENARNLFRLLVGEVLVAMEDEGGEALAAGESPGIEYRILYNKAVEEFICSSEMAYRLLLKEYVFEPLGFFPTLQPRADLMAEANPS